ncbi:folate-binding protein [Nostoc sp. 3335mG]|nr:folate-binding protein [Nostoc sp. 3335mG]
MTTVLRADRTVFRFSGPDAHRLINDVVTGITPTEPGTASLWALLSPQGKILAEGLIGFVEGAYWLDVHTSVADDFSKRMRMYRLRAKVEIDDLRETHRMGFSTEPSALAHKDRLGPVALGYRVIAPVEAAAGWSTDDTAYHTARIANGILHQGSDFPANDTFAHDIGMDMLDGVDFAKGCYVGQEVVSRMKHRGTARRRPVIVSGIDAGSGTTVVINGRDAGTIGQVVDGKAVAILRLDRVVDAAGATVGDKPVTLTLPPWATYQFGEAVSEEAE